MITNVSLSTKEQYLLQDQKTHEEQCILKYENYSNLATDAELKTVFRNLGLKEQEHLQTINQLISGKIPAMGNSQGGSQGASTGSSQGTSQGASKGGSQGTPMPQVTPSAGQTQWSSGQFKASDKDLCIDMLNTEKYVSHAYDTAIFEFKNAQIRDVLNHIQKEEQKHGEAIFSYMQSKGMYSAQ